MELSNEQKNTLNTWIQEGFSLADIQKKITSEFKKSITFMELRLLIDDLSLTLKDPPEAAKTSTSSDTASPPADANAAPTADKTDALNQAENASASPQGSVQVSVDSVTRPGAAMSGQVTFSDNESMGWQLDTLGRLGLLPSKEGYRPSDADLMEFQKKLAEKVQ